MLYYAYGSNLHMGQMSWRCPGATSLGAATLDGYELFFSRVASVRPAEGERVLGGVYRINDEHLQALDRYEGYPSLYRREWITVKTVRGYDLRALVYIMNGDLLETPPSRSYYETIEEGYRDFGLHRRPLQQALRNSLQAYADTGLAHVEL